MDVAAIALGSVGDENLVGGDINPARAKIDFGNLLAQEGISLFRAVAVEIRAPSLVIHRPMHRLHNRRRQWFGDVAYAQADDLRGRIGALVGRYAMGDFSEQIACLYLAIIFVDVQHNMIFR